MFDRTRRVNTSRRSLLHGTAGLGFGALAGSLFGPQAFAAAAPKFKTVEEGFITIAMSGSMPVTGIKDGKIVGSDAEMIVAIAKYLGLGVKPNIMAWSATIEALKTGRADIMCGDMGWSKARANALLLTDAINYPLINQSTRSCTLWGMSADSLPTRKESEQCGRSCRV